MKPNLDKLESLSDDQLKKISYNIDTIGIRKAAAEASKETNRSLDKTCILKERSLAQHFLVDSPDATQASTEILRFAVTGRPDFSQATIKVLEETAFKLSLASGESEHDELKVLNQITVMLARHRNASVRERMAKIQADKLQLRREELEWKKSLQTSSVSASLNSVSSGITKPSSLPAADESVHVAKALGIERRACAMFNLPCHPMQEANVGPLPSPGAHQGSRGSQAAEATGSNGQITGGGVGNPLATHQSASPEIAVPMNTGHRSGDPAVECAHMVATVSSEFASPKPDTRPYLLRNKNLIACRSMICNGAAFVSQTLDQPSFFLRQRAEGGSELQNEKKSERLSAPSCAVLALEMGAPASVLTATGASCAVMNTRLQSGDQAAECNQTLSAVSAESANTRPYLHSEKNSASRSAQSEFGLRPSAFGLSMPRDHN